MFCFCSQIDDKEFDIPQVDTPPTLESILNEVKYMLHFDNRTAVVSRSINTWVLLDSH